MISEQRPGKGRALIHASIWGRSIPDRGDSQCKCPEVSAGLTSWSQSGWREWGHRSKWRLSACVGHRKDVVFTLSEMESI